MFPACLVSTVFVVQNAALMASGVDLKARRASIMSISWGALWAIGGLWWAVFPMAHRPPQLMLMMLARRASKSTSEAIKSSLRSENPDGQ